MASYRRYGLRLCVHLASSDASRHAPCAPAPDAHPSFLTRLPWTALRLPPHLLLSYLQERKQAWGTRQFQQYIGADVTSLLSVPVWIMEPFTILQKAAEIMEYTDLLDSADSTADPYDRWAHGGWGVLDIRGGAMGKGMVSVERALWVVAVSRQAQVLTALHAMRCWARWGGDAGGGWGWDEGGTREEAVSRSGSGGGDERTGVWGGEVH